MPASKQLPRAAMLASFLLSALRVRATFELGMGDDSDLTDFVTRPDIKAPRLNVTKYHPDRVSSGYFFAAPYVRIYQEAWATSYYQPCQSGPHIYDNDGHLVWSGACFFENQNQADFRPVYFNNAWHISGIDIGLEYEKRSFYGLGNSTGYAYIMNGSYEDHARVRMPKMIDSFNMHEFRVVDDGKAALAILYKPEYTDVSMLERVGREAGWVDNMGFIEMDVATGAPKFQWWALDHISLNESTVEPESLDGPLPEAWNCYHLDSVDKTPDGDYLVSSRHTSTVYRISHKTGAIQWRLGGKLSDFKLDGFNFSRQHDARFLNPKGLPFKTKRGWDYVSLFNNAADENDETPAVASILVIALNVKQKTAELVRRIDRPDGGSTLFSGNGEYLSNGNLFASWAGNSYVTEHDSSSENGDAAAQQMVMEARFHSNRFTTYRVFKSDFRATPLTAPDLYCTAYGTSAARATTVCWVSWNGATEVRNWRFTAMTPDAAAAQHGDAAADQQQYRADKPLRTVRKTGFETRMQTSGYNRFVEAEALDADGRVLGKSAPVEVYVAQPWRD